MGRKNLKITEETHNQLLDEKKDHETWDGLFTRLLGGYHHSPTPEGSVSQMGYTNDKALEKDIDRVIGRIADLEAELKRDHEELRQY